MPKKKKKKECMAAHSSILAWRIPWTKEPGGLQSMGPHRVGTTEAIEYTHTHIQAGGFICSDKSTAKYEVYPMVSVPEKCKTLKEIKSAGGGREDAIFLKNITIVIITIVNCSSAGWIGSCLLRLLPFSLCGLSFLHINQDLLPWQNQISPRNKIQFSHSVMSDSLRPHGLQHARPPCPSPTPGVYSNSCPSSQWCHPAISSSVVPFSCLQSFLASGSFSNESVLRIRWPKYWRFSISSSNEYSGLISFRMDWLDLLAVQGTVKSLLQQHRSKASILQCSAFFIVQLSHPYMTPGKTIPLTTWTFIRKVMPLFF